MILELKLDELIVEKSARDGEQITQKMIAAATGIPESTLSRYARGYTSSYSRELIGKLALYFEVNEPNALFRLVETKS